MCQYYQHSFLCKHTSHSFARFCDKASLIQTPCKNKKQVWHTIRMEDACEECLTWFPDRCYPRGNNHNHNYNHNNNNAAVVANTNTTATNNMAANARNVAAPPVMGAAATAGRA